MRKLVINDLLSDLGIIKKDFISKKDITDENMEKVFKTQDGYYYTYDDNGLTDDDIKLVMMAKQAKDVKMIKNMVMFFVVLTCISLALSLYAAYKIVNII